MYQFTDSFTAQRTPYSATGVRAIVGQTTANITFTIPAIAYTPEDYHINFTGLELQNTLNSSTPLSSSSNISTVDEVFHITLTGLEEANTYNYTVVSTNCIGSTSTDVINFTTLPAGERSILLILTVMIIIVSLML